ASRCCDLRRRSPARDASPETAERAAVTAPARSVGPRAHVRTETVMFDRPRRLRSTEAVRRLGRETHLVPSQLVLPLFVAEAATEPRPFASMPGVVQPTRDSARRAVVEAAELGLGGVMLFG